MAILHTPSPQRRHLRALMALERAQMAQERTMLAYVRTGIALVVAGFSLMHFFHNNFYVWVGVLLVPIGGGVMLAGWLRYRQKTGLLKGEQNESALL